MTSGTSKGRLGTVLALATALVLALIPPARGEQRQIVAESGPFANDSTHECLEPLPEAEWVVCEPFLLPMLGRCVPRGMEHNAGSPQRPRSRVLVADRFPIFAHGLRALAESRTQDIEVTEIVDSPEALLDATGAQEIDVIILDEQLPPAGAVEVLRTLKKAKSSAPVLVLSSAEEIHGAPRVLAEGAAGILSKACPAEELFSAVRSIAAGDFVLGAAAAAAVMHRNGHAASQLSENELLLLDLFMAGHTHFEIAKQLLMSESTLKRKFADVQRKLGAKTRVEAVARAARMGLI